MSLSPGAKFRLAVEQNNPLQIVGTVNPYCAMMAKKPWPSGGLFVWRRDR
jgi:methylisocitrate lyase